MLAKVLASAVFSIAVFSISFSVEADESSLEYSSLCPEHTGLFYEPCMKHCADKYSGNACGKIVYRKSILGQCVHFAKEPKKIINECMCFEGLKCTRANE